MGHSRLIVKTQYDAGVDPCAGLRGALCRISVKPGRVWHALAELDGFRRGMDIVAPSS